MVRSLQGSGGVFTGNKEEIIDIFSGLAIVDCLVSDGFELGNRLQLLSIEIEAAIANLFEKSRYPRERTRCMAFLDFDHQLWVLAL